MSNHSILRLLREAACDCESGELSTGEFSTLLDNMIEALEGIPYQVIKEMRTFKYRIEISGFYEEDESISDRKTVLAELRAWLEGIENRRG